MPSPKSVLIDANVLLGIRLADDSLRQRAATALEELSGSELLMPYEIFVEAVTVLCNKAGSRWAIEVCDPIWQGSSDLEVLPHDRSMLNRAWEIFNSIPPHQFSLQDLILLAWAEALACRVVTFDERLEALGRRLGGAIDGWRTL